MSPIADMSTDPTGCGQSGQAQACFLPGTPLKSIFEFTFSSIPCLHSIFRHARMSTHCNKRRHPDHVPMKGNLWFSEWQIRPIGTENRRCLYSLWKSSTISYTHSNVATCWITNSMDSVVYERSTRGASKEERHTSLARQYFLPEGGL